MKLTVVKVEKLQKLADGIESNTFKVSLKGAEILESGKMIEAKLSLKSEDFDVLSSMILGDRMIMSLKPENHKLEDFVTEESK